MTKSEERACAALSAFVASAYALQSAWNEAAVGYDYPEYLPSFDEFVSDLIAWRDANTECGKR